MCKGSCIIIPRSLRPELLQRIHASHSGTEKCRTRARTPVFWPGINAAIDDLVSQYSSTESATLAKQPGRALDTSASPSETLSTVAADIFYYKGRGYLLVVDYFSKCPEVARLSNKTSEAVIMAMKSHLRPPWNPREANYRQKAIWQPKI